MRSNLIASLLLFFSVSCVTVTEEGERVKVMDKEDKGFLIKKCKLIVMSTINQTSGSHSGLTIFEVEAEFRNQAAAKGATHMYWEHLLRLNGALNKGYFYKCPKRSSS